jgi:hypothetical protein
MSHLTFISSRILTGRTYESLLNPNERFQRWKLKFRMLLGRDFQKCIVLLKYLVFKLKKKNKNAEDAELFFLFSVRRTAVGIR